MYARAPISMFLAAALLLAGLPPAFAESKSVTLQTRCVIKPAMQLSGFSSNRGRDSRGQDQAAEATRRERPGISLEARNQAVQVWTNLGRDYRVMERWQENGGMKRRLVTLVAL